MKTINISITENVLRALHKDAKKDMLRMATTGSAKAIFRPIQPSDFEKIFLPISKEQGEDLRKLILDNNCRNIVEFGTSFGISTIYLAQGAQQTGGKVITTELLESKAKRAWQNIKDAEVDEFVEIKTGDAMQTLKSFKEPIDFLFLDGWKDLYLPLFKMLEPQLHKGSIIYADNMDMNDTEQYAQYIVEKKDIYSTKLVAEGKAFFTTVK